MKILYWIFISIPWILFAVLPGTLLTGEAYVRATKEAEEINEIEKNKHNGILPRESNHLYGMRFCKIILRDPLYWTGLAVIIFFTLVCLTNLLNNDNDL